MVLVVDDVVVVFAAGLEELLVQVVVVVVVVVQVPVPVVVVVYVSVVVVVSVQVPELILSTLSLMDWATWPPH